MSTPTPAPTTPRQRVQEFLRQWTLRGGAKDYNPTIYGVHYDPAADMADLTVRDVQAVLDEPDAEGLAAARAVALWELGDPGWANQLLAAYLHPEAAMAALNIKKGQA